MRVANGGKFVMQLIIHSPTDTFQICRHLQPSLLCALTEVRFPVLHKPLSVYVRNRLESLA